MIIYEIICKEDGKKHGLFAEDVVEDALAIIQYRNPGNTFEKTVHGHINIVHDEGPDGKYISFGVAPEEEACGWTCTDDSCAQYARKTGENSWQFYQATLCSDGFYYVSNGTVRLDSFTDEEIDRELAPFYGSKKGLEEAYGAPASVLGQIIAECIFENDCEKDRDMTGQGTLEEVIEEIEELILEN